MNSATFRLFVAFGTGFVGLLYLVLVITWLVKGGVEVSATELSIAELEGGADPSAAYLEVHGGLVVFPLARTTMRTSRADDGGPDSQELRFLSVPIVSPSLWEAWRASMENSEHLDASTCRLIVSFNGEQVGELWPEVRRRAESGQAIDQPPVTHVVVGDTEPALHQISMPLSKSATRGLDPAAMRWMRYEQHLHGPWHLLKNLAIAVAGLGISVLVFRRHRRLGDPSPPGGVSFVEAVDALETSDLI